MFLCVRGSLSNKTLSQTLFTPCGRKSGTNVSINAVRGHFQFLALVNVLTRLVLTGFTTFRQLITKWTLLHLFFFFLSTEINLWNNLCQNKHKSRVFSLGGRNGDFLCSFLAVRRLQSCAVTLSIQLKILVYWLQQTDGWCVKVQERFIRTILSSSGANWIWSD